MASKRTKARRGRKVSRKTRRNRRKMRGSGLINYLKGNRPLTEDDFNKSFMAIRRPLNFGLYDLVYKKQTDNMPESMMFDFHRAGQTDTNSTFVSSSKTALFNLKRNEIMGNIVILFEHIDPKNILNVKDKLSDPTLTREKLHSTLYNTLSNDFDPIIKDEHIIEDLKKYLIGTKSAFEIKELPPPLRRSESLIDPNNI